MTRQPIVWGLMANVLADGLASEADAKRLQARFDLAGDDELAQARVIHEALAFMTAAVQAGIDKLPG